jgi:phospholipid/cholesterol/gamma-HCH transport system ATP-binding protein
MSELLRGRTMEPDGCRDLCGRAGQVLRHQVIWQDVSLTLPAGEVSVMPGPLGRLTLTHTSDGWKVSGVDAL